METEPILGKINDFGTKNINEVTYHLVEAFFSFEKSLIPSK